MEPVFRIDREERNFLSYEQYNDDFSIFCFHSQIELYFVEDGEMDITVNHNRKLVGTGEMAVVLSFDAHTYSTPACSKSSALFIPTYMCPEFMEAVKNQRAISPFIADKKVVSEIKSLTMELIKSKDNPIKMQGYIYLILGIVEENIFFESSEESMDTDLSVKILTYINNNFSENISLSCVASELGYNPSYLSRYFKSCFRVGFNRYLTTVRLKNALLLMKEKKYSLTRCALDSGFNSLRTFYRSFQSEFGCTPKEYMSKQPDTYRALH